MFIRLLKSLKKDRSKSDYTHFAEKRGIALLSKPIADHIAACVARGQKPTLFVTGYAQSDGSFNVCLDVPKTIGSSSPERFDPEAATEPLSTLVDLWS